MGNKIVKAELPSLRNFFTIDRILDANCEYIQNTTTKNPMLNLSSNT